MPEPPDRQDGKNMRALGALSAVGIAFVLAVVIGFLAGYGSGCSSGNGWE